MVAKIALFFLVVAVAQINANPFFGLGKNAEVEVELEFDEDNQSEFGEGSDEGLYDEGDYDLDYEFDHDSQQQVEMEQPAGGVIEDWSDVKPDQEKGSLLSYMSPFYMFKKVTSKIPETPFGIISGAANIVGGVVGGVENKFNGLKDEFALNTAGTTSKMSTLIR